MSKNITFLQLRRRAVIKGKRVPGEMKDKAVMNEHKWMPKLLQGEDHIGTGKLPYISQFNVVPQFENKSVLSNFRFVLCKAYFVTILSISCSVLTYSVKSHKVSKYPIGLYSLILRVTILYDFHNGQNSYLIVQYSPSKYGR